MKKYFCFIFSLILAVNLFPCQSFAFEHGYDRHTDEIYALVRNDLAVYYDNSGDSFKEYIPAFSGVRVVGSTNSWHEVEYEMDNHTKSGWVTKDDFTYNCLTYDGREKQILADGDYMISWDSTATTASSPEQNLFHQESFLSKTSFPCSLTFVTDNSYRIQRKDTGEFLLSDSLNQDIGSSEMWGSETHAGIFKMIRKDNWYGIKDTNTDRYISINKAGILFFCENKTIGWRVIRTNGKVLDSSDLRNFAQFDADWGADYYGSGKNDDPSTNNFTTSACGIFATMNAIYTLTGQYVNPHILADYAVQKHYRIEDNGTDNGFFKAAATRFGYKYGFRYDGSSGSLSEAKKKLQKGDTVIAHVPGHYISIVDYNKKKDKYLILDSHYLPKRGTCSFGDWVSPSDLEEGSLL